MDSERVPNWELAKVDPTRSVDCCARCGARLPLRCARRDERAASWFCAECGAPCHGMLDRASGADLRRHIVLAPLRFATSQLAPPPNLTAEFIAERVRSDRRGPERRAHRRRPIAVPVAALPLDADFFPAGSPFLGMAHNISTSGLALVHTRALAAPQLALELTLDKDHEVRAVIEVIRCQAVGLFYEIAGPFVVRIAPARPLS